MSNSVSNRDQIINSITQKIAKNYNPEKIILFGSAAKNEMSEDSDFDLLIIKNGVEHERNRAYPVRKILRGENLPPLDIFVYSESETNERIKEKDAFISDIFNYGQVVYQK